MTITETVAEAIGKVPAAAWTPAYDGDGQVRGSQISPGCWTQMLALPGTARQWEPKRLRLRPFSAAGRLARGGRRLRLRLARHWPWAADITAAAARLQGLPSG